MEDHLNARDGLEASTSRTSARESGAVEGGDAFVASGRSEVVGTSRRRPWWAMGWRRRRAAATPATRRRGDDDERRGYCAERRRGQTRARIVREHGASLMRFVEDVQLEERSRGAAARARTRKTAGSFEPSERHGDGAVSRVTARGFRITKRVVAKRARGMFEVSARLVGELQKEELRRDVFTATRRGARFSQKRVIQGIEVQVPPLVGFRFDERHVTALWARLASAMSRRFGFVARMRRELLARKKRREEESRAKAEADAKRVGKSAPRYRRKKYIYEI